MLIRQNQATSEVPTNKKTTPDLSIVKRLGGSRAANVRTILQLYGYVETFKWNILIIFVCFLI